MRLTLGEAAQLPISGETGLVTAQLLRRIPHVHVRCFPRVEHRISNDKLGNCSVILVLHAHQVTL